MHPVLFADKLEDFKSSVCMIHQDGSTWTYADLINQSNKCEKKFGKSRSLIFILGKNSFLILASYIAALRGRHVVLLLDPSRSAGNAMLIALYRPNWIVWESHGELCYTENKVSLELHPELLLLAQTSGSTGSPKLAKLSVGAVASNTTAIVAYLGLNCLDRTCTLLKPFHLFGLSVINTHLSVGASIILTEGSIAERKIWNLLRDMGATNFSGVPYTFEIIEKMTFDLGGLSALRFVCQAGGKLSPARVVALSQAGIENGWKFFVMYGQTEASPRMAYLPPELSHRYPDCIGIPIPGGSFDLKDDHGNSIRQVDVPGNLVYRGPNVMMGYSSSLEDLAVGSQINFLETGDIASCNADGLYRIVGRASRFSKMFGQRINLDDVEEQALEAGFSTVAIDDHDNHVMLFLEGTRLKDLSDWLATKYRLPRSCFKIISISEFPRLQTGKIDRISLKSSTLWATEPF